MSAANCAAPEKTISDITTGATEPMTGCASTPKEIPPASVGQDQRQSGCACRFGCRSACASSVTLPYNLRLVVRVTPESIKLQGGALSIDFANSRRLDRGRAGDRRRPTRCSSRTRSTAGARASRSPASPGGPEELELARGLRTALHQIFSALAREQEPDEFSLSRLRFAYAQAVAAGTLAPREDGGFGLDWRADEPRRVRFAVAADAVALLADPARIARLHRCPGRDCGWVFLDMSGRRRWCSMATCGSREKMRRMYERKRAERLTHE